MMLYWRREIRFGISPLYSSSNANKLISLSILMFSAARLWTITSRLRDLGITPQRGMLPCSFTRFFEKLLQTSRILTKFAYELCIW